MLQVIPSHAGVFNETLNTIEPGVQFFHNDLTSQYPWRTSIDASILMDRHFANSITTANTHRSFDHWEYDLTGRFRERVRQSADFRACPRSEVRTPYAVFAPTMRLAGVYGPIRMNCGMHCRAGRSSKSPLSPIWAAHIRPSDLPQDCAQGWERGFGWIFVWPF